MNNHFEKDVNDTFYENVPDILSQIKSDPRFKVPEKNTGFSLNPFSNKKVFAGLLSVFILTLIIVTSYNHLSEPVVASTVTIDINPSIIVTLDKDDYVINVTGVNEDGEEILDRDIKYSGLTIEELVDILIVKLQNSNYIVTTTDDYNIVLINVENNDAEKQQWIKQQFSNKFEEKLSKNNADYWVFDSDTIPVDDQNFQNFKSHNKMSTETKARLTLIYRLSVIQDEYTVQELKNMTVRELYTIYIEYEDQQYLPNYDQMPKPRR